MPFYLFWLCNTNNLLTNVKMWTREMNYGYCRLKIPDGQIYKCNTNFFILLYFFSVVHIFYIICKWIFCDTCFTFTHSTVLFSFHSYVYNRIIYFSFLTRSFFFYSKLSFCETCIILHIYYWLGTLGVLLWCRSKRKYIDTEQFHKYRGIIPVSCLFSISSL